MLPEPRIVAALFLAYLIAMAFYPSAFRYIKGDERRYSWFKVGTKALGYVLVLFMALLGIGVAGVIVAAMAYAIAYNDWPSWWMW